MGPKEILELLATRIIEDAEFQTKRELEAARWRLTQTTRQTNNWAPLTDEQTAQIALIVAPSEKGMRERYIHERIEKLINPNYGKD